MSAVKDFLRSLVAVLDVMLGGDHRQHGHQPPRYCGPPPTKPPPRAASERAEP